jgi:soluble P-type ATPase
MVYYNNSMIELAIPGRDAVQLDHLVCDVNGTLALDGSLIEGVEQALEALRDRIQIHLITADTHGRQASIDQRLRLKATRLIGGDEARQKTIFLQSLGAEHSAAVGQGANDAGMLKAAALGIAVLSPEGLAVETLLAADLVTADILAALDLFSHPLRIVATLRK